MASTSEQTECLLSALRHTQELRASVQHVFETLSDGLKKTNQEKEQSRKQLLIDVQQALVTVNNDISELDKIKSNLNPTGPPSLGNSSMIGLDPALERTPLYTELVNSYKRTSKMHDFSHISGHLLQTNALRRSHISPLTSSKRPKKTPTTCHAINPQNVDQMVRNWSQTYSDMPIVLSRPMGSPAILQVKLGRVLRAVIALRGLIIEWVLVKGYDEDFISDEEDPSSIDIWKPSRYAVFRKISNHCSAAMLHFYAPQFPELAVKSFLKWFHSYNTVFSAPCHQCKKHLQDNLPATWRDFRTLEAYHENCRPKMYL